MKKISRTITSYTHKAHVYLQKEKREDTIEIRTLDGNVNKAIPGLTNAGILLISAEPGTPVTEKYEMDINTFLNTAHIATRKGEN